MDDAFLKAHAPNTILVLENLTYKIENLMFNGSNYKRNRTMTKQKLDRQIKAFKEAGHILKLSMS